MAGFGGSIKLTGSEEYQKALKNITSNLKVVGAEMKSMSSSFDAGEKSEKEMANASKELKASLEQQKSALNEVKKQLSQMVTEYSKNEQKHQALVKEYDNEKKKLDEIGRTLGTSSQEYKQQEKVVAEYQQEIQKSEKSLNNEGKAINDLKIKLSNAETTINQTSKSLDTMGKEAEEAGEDAKKGGDGFTVMKGILANLSAQAITACINGLKNLGKEVINTVNEVGKMGDTIDKESQKLGISAENYQALNYAMERSGSSIDDVSRGMKNITNALDGVQKGTKGAGKDFESLGVSLKNADGSMKSSEQVLLDTISSLANMTDETSRNATANKIFGKSYQELAPLLNSGADGIKSLMNEAKQYGMVMSDDAVKASAKYQDSLLKMQGTMTGLRNNIMGEFLPSVTSIMDGFSDMAIGADGAGEKIKEGVEGVLATIGGLWERIQPILGNIAQEVFNNAPQIMTSLVKGILSAVGQIAPMAGQIISDIVSSLLSGLPDVLSAGVDVLSSLVDGISSAIPQLIAKIPEIITSLVTGIASNLPKLVESGLKLIVALGQGLIQAIPQLVANIPQIIMSIVTGIVESVPKLAEAGLQLIQGLWQGISDAGAWLMEQISGFFGGIVDGIKNFFGIHSPSTLMAESIGSPMAQGIGEGFSNEMPSVNAQMAEQGAETVSALSEGMNKQASSLQKTTGNLSNDIVKQFQSGKGNYNSVGQQTISAVATGINSQKSQLQTTVTQLVQLIQTTFKNASNQFTQMGSQTIQSLNEGLQKGKATIQNTVTDLLNTMVNDIKSKAGDFKSAGEQLINSLNDGLSGGRSTIQNTIKDIVNSIDANAFYNVGVNLAKGLEQGFMSQMDGIRSRIVAEVAKIRQQAEQQEKIKSPSKEWASIGKYMAMGLDVGFTNEMRNVTKDISNVMPMGTNIETTQKKTTFDSMVEAFKEALYGVKVEMDNEEMGRFIDKTVSNLIYT